MPADYLADYGSGSYASPSPMQRRRRRPMRPGAGAAPSPMGQPQQQPGGFDARKAAMLSAISRGAQQDRVVAGHQSANDQLRNAVYGGMINRNNRAMQMRAPQPGMLPDMDQSIAMQQAKPGYAQNRGSQDNLARRMAALGGQPGGQSMASVAAEPPGQATLGHQTGPLHGWQGGPSASALAATQGKMWERINLGRQRTLAQGQFRAQRSQDKLLRDNPILGLGGPAAELAQAGMFGEQAPQFLNQLNAGRRDALGQRELDQRGQAIAQQGQQDAFGRALSPFETAARFEDPDAAMKQMLAAISGGQAQGPASMGPTGQAPAAAAPWMAALGMNAPPQARPQTQMPTPGGMSQFPAFGQGLIGNRPQPGQIQPDHVQQASKMPPQQAQQFLAQLGYDEESINRYIVGTQSRALMGM